MNPNFLRAALTVLLGLSLARAADAQNLTGAGATFPYPLYSKWFDVYHQKAGVAINYQSIGSGAGIQQVRAGTVDFGASDAPLDDAALKAMPRRVLHFPTVAGAVVLAYNLPGLQSPLRLTSELIEGIYLNRITMWNDRRIVAANPGARLSAAPILAVHRSDGSGTTSIFASYLAAVSPEWKRLVGAGTSVSWPSGVGGKGNDGVAGVIRQTPGAIGYVELAYAKHNQLPIAIVRNQAGRFVMPTPATTTAAAEGAAASLARDVRTPIVNSPAPAAYPIAGLTFLLVYQDGRDLAHAKAMGDFIGWAIHEGQGYAEALDYAPLPAAVVKLNEASLRLLTAGGKPLYAAR